MRASNRKLDRSLKVVQHINSYFTKEMTHIVLGSKVKLKKKILVLHLEENWILWLIQRISIRKTTSHLCQSDILYQAGDKDREWRLHVWIKTHHHQVRNFPTEATLGLDNFFPAFPKIFSWGISRFLVW